MAKVAKKKAASKKGTGTEVAVLNEYAVSTDLSAQFEGMGLGAGDEIDTMDILIPKLMLTQGLTKVVVKGKAQVGRFINSVNNKDMGDVFEALVISSYKVWQEYVIVPNGQDEYIQTLDYYANENLPYQFNNEKNQECKRIQVLGFYVLLLDEIKAGNAFPYIIDFKGGSKGAGRELSSHFAKLRSANLPSFAKVFSFGNELVEDKFTYYAKTVSMGRNITGEELATVKNWIADLKKNKGRIKVDDSDLQDESGNAAAIPTEATPVNGQPKF